MPRAQDPYRAHHSQVDDEYLPQQPKKECNDVFFLIIFLGIISTTIYFASVYGNDFIHATKIQNLQDSSGFQIVLKYIVNSAFAAMGMSFLWIILMVCAGKVLIWMALIVIIVLHIVAAYVLTKQAYRAGTKYYYWPGIVFGGIALLLVLYTCCIRKRIRFAAAHLKIAGIAIFRLPMTLIVAIVMVVVHVAWAVAWIVGTVGILYHQKYIKLDEVCTLEQCNVKWIAGAMFGSVFGMLIIFFWGSNVIKNIIAVTVAGTVASWKTASNSACITISAWLRAATLNLGSICFGSLIVAILEALRTMLNMMSSIAGQSGNCVASCLLSCLACNIGCIEHWIEFFNRFAYTYVGCYGYSFITASKHVCSLFASKGWSAIVNDDLTNHVFFLGNLVIGVLTAYIAVEMVEERDTQRLAMFEKPKAIVAFFAFVVGYATNNLFMSVVSSAVTTIFVLWAEDPHGWQMTRPEEYHVLHSAWLEIYPEEYNHGHGKVQEGSV